MTDADAAAVVGRTPEAVWSRRVLGVPALAGRQLDGLRRVGRGRATLLPFVPSSPPTDGGTGSGRVATGGDPMTEAEAAIQRHLDECPGDGLARQVLADELDASDDPADRDRADGYRALGLLGAVPVLDPCRERRGEDGWWLYTNSNARRLAEIYAHLGRPDEITRSELPDAWCDALRATYTDSFRRPEDWAYGSGWYGYSWTRRQAEDAAARAFAALSPADQVAIMSRATGGAPRE